MRLGFPDITLVTIFAWNRVDGATSLIFRCRVFRFRKQIPDGLVWFLSNYDVVILRTNGNWRNRRIVEAWEINTWRNPLNRDDGMRLPHEFLNLALRDRIQFEFGIL